VRNPYRTSELIPPTVPKVRVTWVPKYGIEVATFVFVFMVCTGPLAAVELLTASLSAGNIRGATWSLIPFAVSVVAFFATHRRIKF
jgi:hypothetical protein